MNERQKRWVFSGIIVFVLGLGIFATSGLRVNPSETIQTIEAVQAALSSAQIDLARSKAALQPQVTRAMPPPKLVKRIVIRIPSPSFPCGDCGANLTVTYYRPNGTITNRHAPIQAYLESIPSEVIGTWRPAP